MALRQVRIVSDGSGSDTVVTDESGQPLMNVMSAEISVEARGLVVVTLEVAPAGLDVHGIVNEVRFQCPLCAWSHDHQCNND